MSLFLHTVYINKIRWNDEEYHEMLYPKVEYHSWKLLKTNNYVTIIILTGLVTR